METKAIALLLIQMSTMLLMFAVGLQGRWRDLGFAASRPRLLLSGFIAIYVAVPLVAFLGALLLPIPPAGKIGIVAMALSPLAPLVPGKMLKAGAGPSFVVGMYVALLLLSVVAVPLTLLIVTSLTGGVSRIAVGQVAWLVSSSILAPLSIGMVIAALSPKFALKASAPISLVAGLVLAIVVVLILVAASGAIAAHIGNGMLLAIVAAEVAGLVAGHVLGGPDPRHRMALAQAAAMRHPGLAALMIQVNFEEVRPMLAAVLLYLVTGIVVSTLYNRWANGRLSRLGRASPAGA